MQEPDVWTTRDGHEITWPFTDDGTLIIHVAGRILTRTPQETRLFMAQPHPTDTDTTADDVR